MVGFTDKKIGPSEDKETDINESLPSENTE
jgi:hypothetical protein